MMVFGWIFLSSCIIYTFIHFRNTHELIIKSGRDRIESLIRILCHDISNPLMNIKMRADLIVKKYQLKEEIHLQKTLRSIDDINSIIQQIRLWQSSETGKHEVNLTAFNIEEIIEPLIDQFETKLSEKSLTMTYENKGISKYGTDSNLKNNRNIFADKNILYGHILSNLISNSIKFSPQKSKIQITFDIIEGLGVLEVIDYGIGIPNDLISKIFSVSEATNRKGTDGEMGTGFGLPIGEPFTTMSDK